MLLKALSSCLNILPKNPTSITPNYQLINNQSGFAPILLVMLLLAGITAGVYLTQTGTSFLPKAADNFTYHCDGNTLRSDVGYSAQDCTKNNQICKESGGTASCVENPANPTNSFSTYCDSTTIRFKANNSAKEDCKAKGQDYLCRETNQGEASCVYSPTNNTQTHCGNANEIRNQNGQVTDNCGQGANEGKICRNLSGTEARCVPPNNITECAIYGQNYSINTNTGLCSSTAKPPSNSAAAPATDLKSDQPTSETGGCTKTEAESCKGICYKDTSGKKQCTASKENSSGCSETQQKLCTDKKRNNGCMIIRGEVKCLYSEGAKCDSDDSNSCSQGCAVVQRESQWVSECKATVCSQGYHNFCMATKNKSCEIKDSVPDCTGDPSKAPKPDAPAAAAPRSGTGAPAAPAANPASQRQPAAGTQSNPKPATPAECGLDQDGISIPCFKVGVFSSNDELSATEAQAKIAVERYNQSASLIKDVKSKVNSEIVNAAIAAAEKKNAEAKAYAQACVQ